MVPHSKASSHFSMAATFAFSVMVRHHSYSLISKPTSSMATKPFVAPQFLAELSRIAASN